MALAVLVFCYTACVDAPSGISRVPLDMDHSFDQAGSLELNNLSLDMSILPDLYMKQEDVDMKQEDVDMNPTCVPRNEGNIVVICDSEGLEEMRLDSDGHFALGADIILPTDWEPIPNFSGSFDGRYYTIKGINLDLSIPDESECTSDKVLYNGGFIDVMKDGVIENIYFDGVVGGEPSLPLPADMPVQNNSMSTCALHYGGLIGLLGTQDGEISTKLPVLNNVFVTNIEVYVKNNFGGVISRAGGSELKNVHVIGDQSSNNIFVQESFVGGLANQLEQATTLDSVSVQVRIEHEGTIILAKVGLLAASATNIVLRKVVARGNIASKNPSALPKKWIGGLIGHVSLKQPEKFKLSECAVEPFDSDFNMIETNAVFVGGLIGTIQITDVLAEDGLSYVTIEGCRVGRLSTSKQRLGVSGKNNTGALVGEFNFDSSSNAILFLDNIVIEALISPKDMGACHIAKTSQYSSILINDVLPSDQDGVSSNESIICSGIDIFSNENHPAGWTSLNDEFERSSLVEMFGPLRNQRF